MGLSSIDFDGHCFFRRIDLTILLRVDNRIKAPNSLMAFTEENTLPIFMFSPYLFCASLLSCSENINYFDSKESHSVSSSWLSATCSK